jgi:hypothetical protein
MDGFFLDPDGKRLPPGSIRIDELHANPYPDKTRVRVGLALTPFQKRPEIELTVTDASGQVRASASILEPMSWKLEVTLHLRPLPDELTGYMLSAAVSYPDLGVVDTTAIPLQFQADPS